MNRLPAILGGLLAFAVIFFPLMLFLGLNVEDPPGWVPVTVTVLAAIFAKAAVRGSMRKQASEAGRAGAVERAQDRIKWLMTGGALLTLTLFSFCYAATDVASNDSKVYLRLEIKATFCAVAAIVCFTNIFLRGTLNQRMSAFVFCLPAVALLVNGLVFFQYAFSKPQ